MWYILMICIKSKKKKKKNQTFKIIINYFLSTDDFI